MRSLEFRINAVEQVLKTAKTGWALNYWNTVLSQLHNLRDEDMYRRHRDRIKSAEYNSVIINT